MEVFPPIVTDQCSLALNITHCDQPLLFNVLLNRPSAAPTTDTDLRYYTTFHPLSFTSPLSSNSCPWKGPERGNKKTGITFERDLGPDDVGERERERERGTMDQVWGLYKLSPNITGRSSVPLGEMRTAAVSTSAPSRRGCFS